jgi:hypothetical protein
MLQSKSLFVQISILPVGILILLMALSTPATVYADDPIPPPNNGNCITCHEDLYFLHDTGNWFCLKESPMACVSCHGGNPTTTTKEIAHTNRAPHPIVNEDVSKCQECHPEECYERVELFDRTAGISEILVAAPYTPSYSTENIGIVPVEVQQEQEPSSWINLMEFLPITLVAGFAIIVYFAYRIKRTPKRRS